LRGAAAVNNPTVHNASVTKRRSSAPLNAELVKLAREVIETYTAVATIREECEAAKATAADADNALPVEVAEAYAVLAERAEEALLAAQVLYEDASARFLRKHASA
jgi:hypothetical protein